MLLGNISPSYLKSFPKLIFSNKSHGQAIYNVVQNSQKFKFIPQILILHIENIDRPYQEKEEPVDVSIDGVINKKYGASFDSIENKDLNFFKKNTHSIHFTYNHNKELDKKKSLHVKKNLFYMKEEEEGHGDGDGDKKQQPSTTDLKQLEKSEFQISQNSHKPGIYLRN